MSIDNFPGALTLAHPNLPPSFFEILDIVKTEFETKDAYVEDGIPTFIIALTPSLKEGIENLRSKLKHRGLELVIRQIDAGIKIMIFPWEPARSPPKQLFGFNYPLILFIATIITVAVSGYLTAFSYLKVLQILGQIRPEDEFLFLWGQTALYTLSVMCIVGLHELGHLIACKKNHVEASFPIFIPGIPGITLGTFGAVIMQKTPVLNRDQLFDIGFSGPIVGFITSLIVSYFGYSLSLPVSRVQYEAVASILPSQLFFLPLIFNFLEPYLLSPSSFTHFLHPLAIAGWMGTLITFLNAFPIGQLDGGHVARAVLGPKRFKIFSYIMTAVMLLSGWWSMAILAILFTRMGHPGALDDISPISRNKKILALLFVVIFVSCFTLSPESPLLLFL